MVNHILQCTGQLPLSLWPCSMKKHCLAQYVNRNKVGKHCSMVICKMSNMEAKILTDIKYMRQCDPVHFSSR